MADPYPPQAVEQMQDAASDVREAMTPEDMASEFKREIEGHEEENSKILDKIRDFDKLWDGVPIAMPGMDKDAYAIETATLDFMRNVETVHANVWYSSFGAWPWYQATSARIDPEQIGQSTDWNHVLEHFLYEAKYKTTASVGMRALVQNGTEITGTFWKQRFRYNDIGE